MKLNGSALNFTTDNIKVPQNENKCYFLAIYTHAHI